MAATGKTVTRKSPAKPAAKAAPVAPVIAAEPVIEVVEAVVAPVVDTVIETQAALPAPAAEKEEANMVEQLKTTAQTAFTQATDKARETIEKTVKTFEEAGEFTKGNVEALVESGKVYAAGVQGFGKSYVEEAKSAYETLTGDLKELAAVKSPAELFQLQAKLARRNFDALVAYSSKNTDAALKLANEAFAPISGRISLAAEKISKAA